ncbi:MAG: hypothetical protein Q9224_005491 [Gallowayella concinna]
MDSCIRLLRHINNTYKGVKLSKSYLERAYDIDLPHLTLREVCKAYSRQFGETGVREVSLEADFETPQLPELESPTDARALCYLPELESPTDLPELESPTSPEIRNFHSRLDARTNAAAPPCVPDVETPYSEFFDIDMGSPSDYLNIGTTYPKVVPTLTRTSETPPILSSQPSFDSITTTICSRCLITIQPQNTDCRQEMTMLMGSEWEDFRRIGLGIVQC